jgi:RimJ/RimL family protein N-acetyltransferase
MTNVMAYSDAVTLVGKTVRLEPMQPEHAEALFAAFDANEELWRYTPGPFPVDVAAMRGWMEVAFQDLRDGSRRPFVVIEQATDRVIGTTSYCAISEPNRSLEIGWTWYNRGFWRTAVNTECKYLLLKRAFEELGCIRVQWRADSRNQRSREAILRLGAQFEGIMRKDRTLHDGYQRSSAFYSMLDDEWPARKAWFEERLA